VAAGVPDGTRDLNRNVLFPELFASIAARGRGLVRRSRGSRQDVVQLSRELLAQRGEAASAALALTLLETVADLDDAGRLEFFRFLADELSPDAEAVVAAAEAYRQRPDAETLRILERAAEPPRQELFRRMNFAPGGTAALVGLRADLMGRLAPHPELQAVDDDLLHLFVSWFNRGFLHLVRIDWSSPAILLEKLIAYEAVHEIRGFDDLRGRLSADRRCFAFFHPALPGEPLVFVEVALTEGLAEAILPLIDPARPLDDPAVADTAIFYSISNCQRGLTGVSFGSFLIKQVAVELQAELSGLRTFATLSPVPGFRAWLGSARLGDDHRGTVAAVLDEGDPPDEELRPLLTDLCAHYLVEAKRSNGRPLDPVARFHLGNGARLERIHWLGDPSPRGLERSLGFMVNYLYELERLERNHESYVNDKRVVASRTVRQAAARAPIETG
jgi:malonyl-CoA decarboxylase